MKQSNRSQQLYLVNVSVVIMLLVLVGILAVVLPKPTVSEVEKRELAAKPQWSLRSWFSGEYAEQYDAYYADTFPQREQLVSLASKLEQMQGVHPDDVRIQKRIACFHVEIAPFLFQTLSIILRRRAGEKGLVTFFVIKTLKNFYGRHKISFGRIACSGIQKAQAPLRKEQCLCFGGQRPGTRKCCACVSTRVSGSSPLAASIWAGGTWNRRAISNSASPSCA